MRLNSAVIVGVGGTGSHLLEPLARTLVFHKDGVMGKKCGMVLIDGDKFEAHNSYRQLGTVTGEYKVTAQAARLKSCFKKDEIDIVGVPQYVDKHSFKELILGGIPKSKTDPFVIILAVDNHATRKDVFESVREYGCENVLMLSPGNDVHHGQVLVYARIAGEDVTTYPLALSPDGVPFHPELLNPGDRIPGGCAAKAKSTPQLITANAFAANLCLSLIQAWLDNGDIVDEVHFDAKKFRVRASGSPISLKDLRLKYAKMAAKNLLKPGDRLKVLDQQSGGPHCGYVAEVTEITNVRINETSGEATISFKVAGFEQHFVYWERCQAWSKTDEALSRPPLKMEKGDYPKPGDTIVLTKTYVKANSEAIKPGTECLVLKTTHGDIVRNTYGAPYNTIVHIEHVAVRSQERHGGPGVMYPHSCYVVARKDPGSPDPVIEPRPAPKPSKGTPRTGYQAELNVGDKVRLEYTFPVFDENGVREVVPPRRLRPGDIVTVSMVHEKYYPDDSPKFRAHELGGRDWTLAPGDFSRVDE